MGGFNKKGSKAPAMPNNIGAPLNPVRNGNAPFFGGTSAPSNVMRPNQNPSPRPQPMAQPRQQPRGSSLVNALRSGNINRPTNPVVPPVMPPVAPPVAPPTNPTTPTTQPSKIFYGQPITADPNAQYLSPAWWMANGAVNYSPETQQYKDYMAAEKARLEAEAAGLLPPT
jgi:hypothetical protein